MPRYYPNILFSDGFGSAGDTTWYHRDGKCYTRKKCKPVFPGTPGQMAQASVHQRAMAAWRSIPHQTQLLWNDPDLMEFRIEFKGELRVGVMARYAGSCWVAITAPRGSNVRIISVRRATKKEVSLYDKAKNDR